MAELAKVFLAATGEEEGGEDIEAEPELEFKPLIELPPEIDHKSGEEDEDVIFRMSRTKLFRFDDSTQEWKERAIGDVRFMKHRESSKVRVLMRAERTLRVRANHPLTRQLEIKPHAGSDRSFAYFTPDWSANPETGKVEQRHELYAFRFANADHAARFKDAFEKVQQGQLADLDTLAGGARSDEVSSPGPFGQPVKPDGDDVEELAGMPAEATAE